MIGFDFEVFYRKGKTNVVADALSRVPRSIQFQAISIFQTDLLDRIKNNWLEDTSLQILIQMLQTHNGNYKKIYLEQ